MFARLRQVIHEEKKITWFRNFTNPVRIVFLNFLGCETYFITEFGGIWDSKRIFSGRNKLTYRNMLPLVILDTKYPYPWVSLPTITGKHWIPVNQILGWAFQPDTKEQRRYFLTEQPITLPINLSTYTWTNTLPFTEESLYTSFMKCIYTEQ